MCNYFGRYIFMCIFVPTKTNKMIHSVRNHEAGQQTSDCSVRTLWSLSGKTYEECLEILRSVGRRDNCGAYSFQIRDAYKCIGATWTSLYSKKPTFNQWYKSADHSKNYAVIVRGHIFAVRKGVVYGNDNDSKRLRARVCEFAEVQEFEAPAMKSSDDIIKEQRRDQIKRQKNRALNYASIYGYAEVGGKRIVARHYASSKAFEKAVDNAVRKITK